MKRFLFLASLSLCLGQAAFAQFGHCTPSEKFTYIDEQTGNTITVLTDTTKNDRFLYQTDPMWTADGKYLIFRSSSRANDKGTNMFFIEMESGKIIQATEESELAGTYLANKSNRMFISRKQNGKWNMYEMNLDPYVADVKRGKVGRPADYETFIEKAQSMIIPFTKRTKCKDPEFKADNEKIAGLYKELAKILVDPDIMVKVENDSIKYIDYLIDLTIAFYERFRAYKIENEWIDFSDFEHYAYEILTHDDHKIAKELKGQYKEIMIDEFQDTNEIQFAIAELLSADDLFIVGDIKQSIYRFRSAKPYLMRSLRERPDFKVIDIRENYRSKANIVAFDNAFFSDLMNIDDSKR